MSSHARSSPARRRPAAWLCLAALAVGAGVSNPAVAQDPVPSKSPLAQPKPVEEAQRLKISYLAEVPRGAQVTLLMMSGVRVSGRLLNVKSEHDVVVIQGRGPRGRALIGCYKAVAIAGVEWSPR